MTKLIAYNRKNKDYDAYLGEQYIGSFKTYTEADEALTRVYSEMVKYGVAA